MTATTHQFGAGNRRCASPFGRGANPIAPSTLHPARQWRSLSLVFRLRSETKRAGCETNRRMNTL
jgi:hypothetical protein